MILRWYLYISTIQSDKRYLCINYAHLYVCVDTSTYAKVTKVPGIHVYIQNSYQIFSVLICKTVIFTCYIQSFVLLIFLTIKVTTNSAYTESRLSVEAKSFHIFRTLFCKPICEFWFWKEILVFQLDFQSPFLTPSKWGLL